MIDININNGFCKIVGKLEHNVLRELDDELSFQVPGAKYIPYYGRGWDGVKRLLDNDLTFDYGLLNRVKSILERNNVYYNLNDIRSKTHSNVLDISNVLQELGKHPRPYQIEAASKVFDHDCGIVRMATGSGKCNSVDSLHITEYGILDYSELLGNLTLEKGEAKNFELKVATPLTDTKTDMSSMIYYDGYSISNKIITKSGYNLTCTPDHKIKILDRSGNIVWKKSSDLNVGDYAVISPNTQMFGDLVIPNDKAYWYGLLIGSGCISIKNKITLKNVDEHILSFSERLLQKKGLNVKSKKSKSKAFNINIYSASYKEQLIENGFKESSSYEKEIPVKLRRLAKKPLSMLIRGIYEADGWVKNNTLCIGFSSKKLIDQLHLILLNYGIVSSKRVKKTNHKNSYIITIYREYIDRFMNEIGLDPKGHKFKKLTYALKNNYCKNTNVDIIPHQNIKLEKVINSLIEEGILTRSEVRKKSCIRSWIGSKAWRNPSRLSLMKFLETLPEETVGLHDIKQCCIDKYHYEPIKSIESVFSENYDFVIPKTHSFVSQGFINHNTLVSSLMVANLNKSTIFYVIGTDLLHQTYKFFKSVFRDYNVGIIGDGYCEIGDITIASVWTVGCALGMKKNKIVDEVDGEVAVEPEKHKDIRNLLKNAKVHILDECHAAACDTIQEIFKNIRPEHAYGLSASPWRDDNSDLLIESLLGNRIIDISASYLIDRGWLVKPIINFLKVDPYHERLPKNYQTVYKKYIIENDVRNNLIVDGASNLNRLGYKTLILYDKIAHGKILYDKISAKMPCAILSGKDDTKAREEVKKKIENGDISCVLASKIFDIGVDIPILSGLIAAGGGKSSVRALQRIGRVIRPYAGKKSAAIIDFADQAHYLKDHSKIRKKIYQTEKGFEVRWPKI